MAVLVDQFATIFLDHSERKPSCFRFEDPVGRTAQVRAITTSAGMPCLSVAG